MQPISTRSKRLKIPKVKAEYNEKGEQIYCICRKPDQGELMIQCDHCKEWYSILTRFHGECVGVNSDSEAPDSYSCEKCLQLFKECTKDSPVEERDEVEPMSAGSEGSKRPVSAESGKRKAPSPIQPEIEKKPKVTVPSKTDKIRRMARKGFEETIFAIFTELVEKNELLGAPLNPEIDFEDPTLFAEELEEELFKLYNNDGIPNDTYKSKFRSIQFNLKDPSNHRLRRRICCLVDDKIDKAKLVSLTPEELGNEKVLEQAEKVARDFVKQTFKPAVVPEVKEEKKVTAPPLVVPEPKKEVESLDSLLTKMQTPIVPSATADQPSLESLLSKLETTPITANPVDTPSMEVEPEPDREFIWSGSVKMPQEGAFNGSANQVCGPAVPNIAWIDIVPSNIIISGRINQTTASKYIYERLDQKSDIVVLEFIPDEKSKSGFHKLTKYFSSKQRFGVISVKNQALKDIYLCPVLKQQPLLPIISDLRPSFPIQNVSDRDRFFATIIFSTGYLQRINQKFAKPPPRPKPVEPAPQPRVVVQPTLQPEEDQQQQPPNLLEAVGIPIEQVGQWLKELIASGTLE